MNPVSSWMNGMALPEVGNFSRRYFQDDIFFGPGWRLNIAGSLSSSLQVFSPLPYLYIYMWNNFVGLFQVVRLL